MPYTEIVIYTSREQHLRHIDAERQDWLERWKQIFQKEIEDVDNEKNRNATSK